MSIENGAMEVEITIAPAKGRRSGRKAAPKVPDPPRIARITRLMALAIKFQDMIDRGEVRDYADIARLGYVTRARLTQIMNLLLLAPDIQDDILSLEAHSCDQLRAEHSVRRIASIIPWSLQRGHWSARAAGGRSKQ